MSQTDFLNGIKQFLVERGFPSKLEAVVILGSGLGAFGNEIQDAQIIPYQDIPGFPQSTVAGHSGALICGLIDGARVLAFSGRFHHYEGHPFEQTVLPVQLAKIFDADKLIISNAAGGINLDFRVGDLMVIEDIIQLHQLDVRSIQNPKQHPTPIIADRVQAIASLVDIRTQRGTYLYVKGPNYETKAEIHFFRKMGGDAVGMSTAPELAEAARLGLKTTAISLISNAAAGITDQKLNHEEVKVAAEMKKDDFAKLVKQLIKVL